VWSGKCQSFPRAVPLLLLRGRVSDQRPNRHHRKCIAKLGPASSFQHSLYASSKSKALTRLATPHKPAIDARTWVCMHHCEGVEAVTCTRSQAFERACIDAL
jgi:hypothetical protein